MEPNERRFEKGFFTRVRFAIAEKYPVVTSRTWLFRLGLITGGTVAALLIADAAIGRTSLAAGPLSENHALFARDCSTCHTPGRGVANASCEGCHQHSSTRQRAYPLARHYEYRSGDADRTAPKRLEPACAECHREHQGRMVALTAVADNMCTGCHTAGSFSRGHPEFQFAREQIPDPANLKFTHVVHVREVMETKELTDAEQACLECHVSEPDGRFFKPVSYANGCDGCHLDASGKTPYIRSGGRPGVASLAEIRRAGGPGTQWADYWNSSDFTDGGGTIRKSPVFHADPWVMHNLSRLRREMYPNAELADLLRVSSEMPAASSRVLYEEAIATLETQLASLQANPSPDVRSEVAGLEALLEQVRARLDDPSTPLDETQFAVNDGNLAAGIDEPAYTAVVDSLTKLCQECHVVQRATLRRVQSDQRALVRSEFDHRKHVLHAGCLDCHSVIPIKEALENGAKVPPERDRAEIQNLPVIAKCQSCHSRGSAPVRCTSCHLFHPDKSHWANLSR